MLFFMPSVYLQMSREANVLATYGNIWRRNKHKISGDVHQKKK